LQDVSKDVESSLDNNNRKTGEDKEAQKRVKAVLRMASYSRTSRQDGDNGKDLDSLRRDEEDQVAQKRVKAVLDFASHVHPVDVSAMQDMKMQYQSDLDSRRRDEEDQVDQKRVKTVLDFASHVHPVDVSAMQDMKMRYQSPKSGTILRDRQHQGDSDTETENKAQGV
jgi:uncharacterized protein YlbG (UPF0298 family)